MAAEAEVLPRSTEELVAWAAELIQRTIKWFAPRGWNEETLASRKAFDDEYCRRLTLCRDDEDILRLLAEVALVFGEPSTESRVESIEILKRPPSSTRTGGRNRDANLARDAAIFTAVNGVCRMGNLRPSRNDASFDKESGCSIISKAMSKCGRAMPEKTVASVYRHFLKRLEEAEDWQMWINEEIARGK